jgi:amino acid transporter
MMHGSSGGKAKPEALSLLAAERPRNVSWVQAAGLLFGDWGTSRLYVLGLAFLFAGRTSFYLILLMSLLIVAVGWAYSQICRIYPDGGGVYTAAKSKSKTLAVVGALLLFADYTVTASLSALDAFHYFGLHRTAMVTENKVDAGDTLDTETEHHVSLATPPTDAIAQPEFQHLLKYDAEKHTLVFHGKDWWIFDRPMTSSEHESLTKLSSDASYQSAVEELYKETQPQPGESLLAWDSPGLWAIVAIFVIGLFNLMGPKHTGGFAIFAAGGMIVITLLITIFALPQIDWHEFPHRMAKLFDTHGFVHRPGELWISFVSIVLALSGVEAIANLTGVMKKPVAHTAKKAIFVVTAEVAIFNVLLAVVMMAIFPLDRSAHTNDMLAYLAGFYTNHYIHGIGEWLVRIVGGLLLLSATNTALTDMISVQYLMARDGELPLFMQKLNRFGVPWVPAVVAASVPILVLLISHDLEALAALYAIGVIGAVAINVTLCATHPRLRRMHRKIPMVLLGMVLLAIWISLAFTKLHALLFVITVMVIGLTARALTKWLADRKGPRVSLLRQAISEQLTPEAMMKPKILLGTYGSEVLAPAALAEAKKTGSTLVVCFIRQVNLSYKYDEKRLTIDSDLAALRTFSRILDAGHELGVSVLPIYDTGPDAAELIAENAAIYGCGEVLIGSSRQGVLYHLIKGTFQRRLESILPPEIPVKVLVPAPATEPAVANV